MGKNTIPCVFMIESNSLEDEKAGRKEGQILSDILRMLNKDVEYRYIRTEKELGTMVHEFAQSNYRYLHIASHGEKGRFHLTLDVVPYRKFAQIAGPYLTDRRLFLSVCSIARLALAEEVYRVSRPTSITGPRNVIGFSESAAVWVSLYSLLFNENPDAISGETIREYLRKLCRLHGVRFAHYGRVKGPPHFRAFKFG